MLHLKKQELKEKTNETKENGDFLGWAGECLL